MTSQLKKFVFVCVLAASCAVTACGNSGSDLSLTGPSSGGSGATIAGRVNGGSGLASTTHSTGGGLTVTIVGTTTTAPVDATGSFTLTNVPAGTVQLEFTGPGVRATVTITVGAQEQIQIAITVNGNSAHVESEHRSGSNRVDIDGQITAVDPAARTLRVAGTLVNVPADAVIRRGSQAIQFADLMVGDRVEVRGTLETGAVRASEVKVKSERRGELSKSRGIVSGLTGTCPTLSFTVGTTRVATNGSTYFKERACASVLNGVSVEVEGRPQTDGSLLAVQVKPRDEDEDDDDEEDDDDDDNEAEIKGAVSGVSGTCPAISFVVGTTRVTTTATTRFDGGCTAVQNMRRVEVKGMRQMDGSVVATRVEIDD